MKTKFSLILIMLAIGIVFAGSASAISVPIRISESVCSGSYVAGTQVNCTGIVENYGSTLQLLVDASITLPDGTIQNLVLSNSSPHAGQIPYGASLIATMAGTYNIDWHAVTYYAGNLLDDVHSISSFTVVTNIKPDKIKPVVTDLTTTTQANTGDIVELLASATDNVNIASVEASVTMPGGIIEKLPMTNIGGSNYQLLFSDTQVKGRYVYKITATDGAGNSKTVKGSFKIVLSPAAQAAAKILKAQARKAARAKK